MEPTEPWGVAACRQRLAHAKRLFWRYRSELEFNDPILRSLDQSLSNAKADLRSAERYGRCRPWASSPSFEDGRS